MTIRFIILNMRSRFLPEDFGIYQLNGLDVVGMKHLKKWLRL